MKNNLRHGLLLRVSCCLLTILCLLATRVNASDSTHLVIAGDSNHPPYSYVEDGINKGISVDIFTSALRQTASYSYTIKLFPWKRALNVAQSGRGHALFTPHYFPEKRPYLSHYSKPILKECVSVYCHLDALSRKVFTSVSTVLSNAQFKLG